jgi:hypothetical protein
MKHWREGSARFMKKIIAIILAVVIFVSAIIIFPLNREESFPIPLPEGLLAAAAVNHEFDEEQNHQRPPLPPISVSDTLSGQDPRDGYILAPALVSLSGVDSFSPFVLQTPAGYGASMPAITIDGVEEPPQVRRENENTFIITPQIPLTTNSVYVFRISRDSEADITWAFQTAVIFEIVSTLPRNQSANVPVRTGIEIDFSFGDAPNIEEHFTIYPHAEGRFISRGSTAIFMPTNPLEYGRIYTVTISAGVSLPNTGNIIGSDYTFSFETAPETGDAEPQWNVSNIHFHGEIVEFPSFAAPRVSFWFHPSDDPGTHAIQMNLYRLESRNQGIEAARRFLDAPHWSIAARMDRLVDTSNLTRVSSSDFNIRLDDRWGSSETFDLPSNLPPGFYVLNAAYNNGHSQVLIQITDLAVQVVADESRALVWINDMTTGAPAAGARVLDPVSGRTFTAADYGIAVVDRTISNGEYLIITAADGKENVTFFHSAAAQWFHSRWGGRWHDWEDWGWNPWRAPQNANSRYWSVLQLDRTLFQRSDTVSLWGFVQNRRQAEDITFVTAVLTEHTWWGWDDLSGRDTLHRQNIPVIGGAYSGEIRLPNLSPGSYEIAIFHGDVAINTIFFTVMDYVTPPYRLSVSADAAAIFAGEQVTFTAQTAFFEGTPVPDLDISYNFWGWGLSTPSSGRRQTNLDGIVQLIATPTAQDATVHGERSISFTAEATLPEIGWVHQETSVRVFVNDIHMRPRATREGASATLTVDVHNITLDRINDGTAERWSDFLDTPRAGQNISVAIYEIYWEAIRIGEWYDHITRQVIPRYRYERRERFVERFEITTDAEGFAERSFTVPNRDRASYEARLTTRDGNGRAITHHVFIGRDFTSFFWDAEEGLFLDGASERGYDIGDNVSLTVMSGTEAVAQGNFLFVVVQDGILSYHIGRNPLEFTFSERHVPNVQVFAYHFNGHTFQSGGAMSQRLIFNPTDHNLNIEVTANQNEYRPGDMVTFTVTTTDNNCITKAAHVNISLVDEALFSLMDYEVDTLAMLY